MQLVEGDIQRRMIHVEAGEDLLSALETLAVEAGWTEAFVSGAGSLELVELAGEPGQPPATLEDAGLLTLSGRVVREGGRCVATLRAAVNASGDLHAGRITAAVTRHMLLVVDAATGTAEPAVAREVAPAPPPPLRPDPRSGAREPVWAPEPVRPAPEAVRLPPSEPSPSAPDRLDAAGPPSNTFTPRPMPKPIVRSGRSSQTFEDLQDVHPEPGDLLDHPQLGVCEVEGEDNSGRTLIVVPSGKRRALMLDALEVLPAVTDGEGRRVFKIAGPRARR